MPGRKIRPVNFVAIFLPGIFLLPATTYFVAIFLPGIFLLPATTYFVTPNWPRMKA
jgi:hypothetical protein